MFPKFLLSAVAFAALVGCGGGSDDNGTAANSLPVTAAPTTAASAEGFWQGTTNTGRTVRTVVLEDGSYWALYSGVNNAGVVAGAVQGNGTTTPGSFSSTNGRDFSIEAASITNSTLSASYASRQFFNGSLTSQAVGNVVTFTSSYRSVYEQAASLATLAGTYAGTAATSGGTSRATITIGSSGAISGTSDDGCRFTGSASVHKVVNIYDVSISFQGGTCSNGTSITNGIAYLEGSSLYAAALNSARSNGFLATVARTSTAVGTTTLSTSTGTNTSSTSTSTSTSGSSGCGSRGGPGYRLSNGNCASWADYYAGRS